MQWSFVCYHTKWVIFMGRWLKELRLVRLLVTLALSCNSSLSPHPACLKLTPNISCNVNPDVLIKQCWTLVVVNCSCVFLVHSVIYVQFIQPNNKSMSPAFWSSVSILHIPDRNRTKRSGVCVRVPGSMAQVLWQRVCSVSGFLSDLGLY